MLSTMTFFCYFVLNQRCKLSNAIICFVQEHLIRKHLGMCPYLHAGEHVHVRIGVGTWGT